MIDNSTSKTTIIILVAIIIILALILVVSKVQNKDKLPSPISLENPQTLEDKLTTKVSVVPTMQDDISGDSTWCGTFQLVWNDMQNNLVDGDVKFPEPNDMVTNLNKQSFTEENISEDYYYKNWGVMSPKLKSEIEKGIENKFNEESDILDLFDWPTEEEVTENEYFFYSMLRRDFEFENEFSILEKNKFANTEDIEYFGINNETNEVVRNQVEVLYYNGEDDFAVVLYTKQGDNVMLVRNAEGKNFEEIYKNADKKASKYKKSKSFGEKDTLAVPNLNIDILREYTELEHKPFMLKDGDEASIDQAFQTIKMKLDSKGGSIKSEAGMLVVKSDIMIEETRNFNFNDKFTIFLLTESNEPYFAANIENIENFK